MNLRDYVREIGDEAFASKFNVTIRAARSYRLGERFPSREMILKLIKKSPLTLEDIFRTPLKEKR